MRILFIHPNYHSGGAEIAGNWPPAWVAYLSGPLKAAGFTDIHFIDAMTEHVDDDALAERIRALKPDIVGTTAITPSIYKAERTLQLAKSIDPAILTVLGGIHATFMYPQVFGEAPWIDIIVRGEGEDIMLAIARAHAAGALIAQRAGIQGIAYLQDGKVLATKAAPTVKDFDAIAPDWSLIRWENYIYIPLGVRVAIPNMARGCPFTCSFCSQWKFWRDYRIRDPKKVVDEIEALIIKPDAMDRGELLDRVMNNYRRFYMKKALFSYPWSGTGQRRRYLLGCLWAYMRAGFKRSFYDLGRVGYWGPQSRKKVDFKFDTARTRAPVEAVEWQTTHNRKPNLAHITACGGTIEKGSRIEPAAAEPP